MAEEKQPNIDSKTSLLSQSEIRSLASLFYPHIVDYYDNAEQAVAFEESEGKKGG